MVITIITEPRSGGTNLANWFINKKDFTILYEPITSPDKIWYKHGVSPKLWSYKTQHILIKETYDIKTNFSELIEISDKLIILYRENITEQTESWLNASKTNNWDKAWVFKENLIKDEWKHNLSWDNMVNLSRQSSMIPCQDAIKEEFLKFNDITWSELGLFPLMESNGEIRTKR